VKVTSIEIDNVGRTTRAALEALHENGFDLVGELPPLSGLAQ
jgi:hypothetical protein